LNASQVNQVVLRRTKIQGCASGLLLGGAVGSTFDLGRGNSPGLNTFTGASVTNLRLELAANGTAYAVGNTWDPGIQGAAAVGSVSPKPGEYAIPDGKTVLDIVGAQTGTNYTIAGPNAATTTLRLAEQP
jgi:hypothetical protein